MNNYFHNYNFYEIEKEKDLDSTKLILINHFQTMQQTTDYTCGPCCVWMVLNHFLNNTPPPCEMELAKRLKTDTVRGTYLKSMLKVLTSFDLTCSSSINSKKDKHGKCFSSYKDFKNFVISNLKQENLIIIENVDYGGHYRIIIGFEEGEMPEQDIFVFADPSDFYDGKQDGYNYGPAERFFYMWFDDHCIEKRYRIQPYILVNKPNLK